MKCKYPNTVVMLISVLIVTVLGSVMMIPTLSQAMSNRLIAALANPTECAGSWDVISSPNIDSSGLASVAAISSNDVWAVGYYYNSNGVILER